MLTFGKAAPKYMEFRLDGDEAVHRLPLAGSIRAVYNVRMFDAACEGEGPAGEAKTQALMLDMFRDYLGEAFAESLDASTMLEIWNAWREESAKANQEPGE